MKKYIDDVLFISGLGCAVAAAFTMCFTAGLVALGAALICEAIMVARSK